MVVHKVYFAGIPSYYPLCSDRGPQGPPKSPGGYTFKNMVFERGVHWIRAALICLDPKSCRQLFFLLFPLSCHMRRHFWIMLFLNMIAGWGLHISEYSSKYSKEDTHNRVCSSIFMSVYPFLLRALRNISHRVGRSVHLSIHPSVRHTLLFWHFLGISRVGKFVF